ncbi:DUF6049 family protein [Microbacterium sp. KR10-403]|uniref:DUF6049 family protein n=1 Tax=Microbacterium sp. KR10-403 TaxID=3158581 RepID=UPI0032E39CF9
MRASQAAPRPSTDPRTCGDRKPHRRRRFAALATATALVVAPLFTTPAAFAADPTPTPSPSPTPLSGTVDAFVSPDANGVLEPDEDLITHVTLRNGTDTAVPATDVTLSLGTARLTSRSELTAWLDAGTGGDDADGGQADPASVDGTTTALGTGSIAVVESGETESVEITVSADDKALTKLKPGVYPLSATITGPAQTRVATSVLTVPKEHDTDRTPVAIVVPITVGGLDAGLLSADQLETLTAPDGELTAELNAVAGTSAILAIDPALPASIRVLGSSAPKTATAWLERLDMLSNERFALQFGDADIAAQLHEGRSSLLRPATLQSYMNAADFSDDDTASTGDEIAETPTPTDTATPGAPTFPSIDELESLGENTRDAVYWPFSKSVGAAGVTKLDAMSTDDTDAVTLLSSASASSGSAHVDADGANVLVYDAAISDTLRTASLEDDSKIRGAALASVTASLNIAASSGDGSPLMVVVDRASTRSVLGLSAAVEAVTGAPSTTASTLTRLLDSPARQVTVKDAAADTARVDTLKQLIDGERGVAAFATVLDDPTLLTAPERATVLQLMGGGWLDDSEGWADAIAAHRQATIDTLNSVSIAPTSDFNLAGRAATRSFGIRNQLPWPVKVTLFVHPDNLRLEVQESTEVTAQASSTTAAHVPIQAQIGNGDVTLNLRLVSPTGVPIGQPRDVVVTVHADWEIIGLTVLGVGIGAFLVIGVVRTVLSRRRRAADAAAAAAGGISAPDAGGDGSAPRTDAGGASTGGAAGGAASTPDDGAAR